MYVIDQSGKRPIFQINQHIGFDDDTVNEDGSIEKGDGQGIDGRLFSKEFFETDILSPNWIDIYVNTMGGDVQQSLDMLTAITRVKAKTKGIISGFAYSCGGWIPMGCDIVHMNEHASWMCHLPYDPNNPEKRSEFLDAVLNMVATIISSKSGRNGKAKKTVQEVKDMMFKKTYMNAKQMYDEGLIDDIIDLNGNKIQAPKEESFAWNIETDYKVIKSFYKEQQVSLNKLLNTNKKTITVMSYPKVANRLNTVKIVPINLTDDAGEDEIVSAISKLENKALNLSTENKELEGSVLKAKEELKASNESKEEMQKRMTDLQSSKNSIDEEVVNLKAKMENMEAENKELKEKQLAADNKIKEAEQKVLREKATNLINEYVKVGKITASNKEELKAVVDGWVEDAVVNYDKTKRQLDAIPLKMAMPTPSFEDGDTSRPDAGSGSIKEFQALNKAEREKKLAPWKENMKNQFAQG